MEGPADVRRLRCILPALNARSLRSAGLPTAGNSRLTRHQQISPMSESEPQPIKPPEARPPFQFGLRSLFLVTLVCAGVCAMAVQFGAPGVLVSIVLALLVLGLWHRPSRAAAALAGAVLLLGALFFLLPGVGSGPPTKEMMCSNNLKQIGLALLNYHNVHGCFPPAYITDESGRPIHSWRVLILPFIEQDALYEEYRFAEPWDGPHNRKWIDTAVSAFHCPGDDSNADSLMTNYVAVVGPDTAWPGSTSAKMSDFGDGISKTILVVEVADSGIHWMEPRDLHVVQMAPGINPKAGQGISSKHPGVVNVLFGDGSVRSLPVETLPETIRALLTRNGGEKLDLDKL
jgi:prepilin-type processing-associated H-X9-DG protein